MTTRQGMKRLIATIFVFEAFAITLFFLTVWFVVSMSHTEILLSIDAMGERTVEYLLWLVFTPILVLGFHYTLEFVLARPEPSRRDTRGHDPEMDGRDSEPDS